MKLRARAKRLEAYAEGFKTGLTLTAPKEYYSHYYPMAYHRGYKRGIKSAVKEATK